jgi:hypothetical protein
MAAMYERVSKTKNVVCVGRIALFVKLHKNEPTALLAV